MPEQIIRLPDGSEAHFPDGTPDSEILSAIAAQQHGPMTFMDRVQQGAQAVNKGVAGVLDSVADAPQNLWNLSKAGAGMVNLGMNKATGGYVPYDQEDYDVSKGFAAPDSNGQSYHPVARFFRDIGGIQDQYEPNDLQGRLIDTAGQIVGGGGINPRALAAGAAKSLPSFVGSLTRQVLPAAGAAAGKEAMYQVAPDSQAGQFAGALLGGGIGAGAQLIRPSIGTTANNALKNVSPQQMAQADALLQQSHSMGAPVTGAEALSAAQAGQNPLLRVQRVVENSPGGSTVMDQFMGNRQAGNAQAVDSLSGQISPNRGVTDQLAVPGNVRDAAAGAISDANAYRTKMASPYYQAADSETLPFNATKPQLDAIVKALGVKGAQSDTGKYLMDYYNQLMPNGPKGLPENRVGVLDTIYQENRNKLSPQAVAGDPTLRSVAANVGPVNSQLGDLLVQGSPNIYTGRRVYQDATKSVVDPITNSPVGQIASLGENSTPQTLTGGIKSALQIDSPIAAVPDQVRYTAARISQQDPTALADFAKQHIQSAWDDANKFIRGTVPQFSGARFAQAIAGNQAQRQNLTALVEGASGPQAAQGLNNVLDVFNAQAKRLEPGSATAFNQQIADELGSGGVANKVAGAASPKAWVDWVEKFRYAKNADEFANILTSPDSIAKLQKVGESFGSRAYRAAKQGAMSGISSTRDQFDAVPPAAATQP